MDWEELYGDFYGYGDDPDSLVVRPNCVALGFSGDYGDGEGGGLPDDDFPARADEGEGWDFEDWEEDEQDPDEDDEDGEDDYAAPEEDC
ncbi:MAG: hypothetical protein HZB23_08805 [Deltaproteobacteria bacterium]|nr:hypothetical protein [Deltaproteobacteria bacterium]